AVTRIGKAATFGLMWAFPTLLMAAIVGDGAADPQPVLHVLGWTFYAVNTVPPIIDHAAGLQVVDLVHHYLNRAHQFADHAATRGETECLFQAVRDVLVTGGRAYPLAVPPDPDKRIERVMAYIESNPQAPYSVKKLTEVALTSERNLYILMKKQTGLAPYQYLLRVRLFQVRYELISSQSEDSTIAWHALNKGFTHLGRFSAQYCALFGELPSETLSWKRELQQFALRSL
ncbi:MAG: AraC family transcriptional regulator, partial [Natronospirillum sp.]